MPAAEQIDKSKPAAGQPAEQKPAPKPADPKAATTFLSRLVGTGTEVKVPELQPKTEAKPEKKEEKPKPAEKKPKTPAVPTAPALDTQAIVDAAAEGAARAFRETEKKPEEKKVENDFSQFGADEQRRIKVLERMAGLQPDKYKGIVEKYTGSLKKLMDYADDWEKKNPGKPFDEDDPAHEQFYKDNDISWEDDDYTEALADIKADEKFGSKNKEIDKRFEEIDRGKRFDDAKPVIRNRQIKNARSFWGQIGDEYKDVLSENGTVNQEALKKLHEENPVAVQIAVANADVVETYTRESYALFNDLTAFNDKNPVHQQINNFVVGKEKELMQKPKAEQIDAKGRQFMPAADFWKLPEAKRQNFWTFTSDDVELLLTARITKHAKEQIKAKEDEFIKIAKARGITLPEKKAGEKPAAKAEEKPKKEAEEEVTDPPVTRSDKPRSPSAAFQPAGGDRGEKGADTNGKPPPLVKFANKFLGKT